MSIDDPVEAMRLGLGFIKERHTKRWEVRDKCRGAIIAQWIGIRLPSCCPGFESQANHIGFNQIILEL